MKKIFLVTGIVVATTFVVTYAQGDIDDNNAKVVKSAITDLPNEIQKEGRESNQNAVSEATKNQFSADFPNASNISFEKTKDFEEVRFNQDGSQKTAYYDFDNQLEGTTINKSFHDLPAVAQTKILDKYKDYAVKDVLEFKVNSDNESYYDDDTYMTLYGNSFDKSNNYFVELKSDNNAIVLEVDSSAEVSYFTTIK
jgi:hypothetical protein